MTASAKGARRRAAVVVNPTKIVGTDLSSVLSRLCSDEGWDEPIWLETTADDPGAGQTRAALQQNADLIIGAGGDGTIRSIASALAGTDVPLGLIPLGTGNLLARNLDIDVNDTALAARRALTGTDRRIDVIRATLDDATEEHVFLVMAGLGFDAAIMAGTREDLKDKIGWLAYVEAGIRHLPGRPVKARITIDETVHLTRRTRSIMAGNCGTLQGGVDIFPDAKIADGLMDLMTIAPRGRFGWWAVLGSLLNRGRGKNSAVEYFQGKSVQIRAAHPQEIQFDGDDLGTAARVSLSIGSGELIVRR